LDILKALERQDKKRELLELNCFLTSKLNAGQSIFLYLLNEKIGLDPVTGLVTKTRYGRPNFDKLFRIWMERFKGKTVGIFYCGPKSLGKQLKWHCIEKSQKKTNFKFHQETF
jgi:NADPH oxidase 2